MCALNFSTHVSLPAHAKRVGEARSCDTFETPNARSIRDRSFNLYLNENYGEREAADTAAAILKVERHFGR